MQQVGIRGFFFDKRFVFTRNERASVFMCRRSFLWDRIWVDFGQKDYFAISGAVVIAGIAFMPHTYIGNISEAVPYNGDIHSTFRS